MQSLCANGTLCSIATIAASDSDWRNRSNGRRNSRRPVDAGVTDRQQSSSRRAASICIPCLPSCRSSNPSLARSTSRNSGKSNTVLQAFFSSLCLAASKHALDCQVPSIAIELELALISSQTILEHNQRGLNSQAREATEPKAAKLFPRLSSSFLTFPSSPPPSLHSYVLFLLVVHQNCRRGFDWLSEWLSQGSRRSAACLPCSLFPFLSFPPLIFTSPLLLSSSHVFLFQRSRQADDHGARHAKPRRQASHRRGQPTH